METIVFSLCAYILSFPVTFCDPTLPQNLDVQAGRVMVEVFITGLFWCRCHTPSAFSLASLELSEVTERRTPDFWLITCSQYCLRCTGVPLLSACHRRSFQHILPDQEDLKPFYNLLEEREFSFRQELFSVYGLSVCG